MSADSEPKVKSAPNCVTTNRSSLARQHSGVVHKPTEAWQVNHGGNVFSSHLITACFDALVW